jgi:hypothetical protein
LAFASSFGHFSIKRPSGYDMDATAVGQLTRGKNPAVDIHYHDPMLDPEGCSSPINAGGNLM